MKKAQVQIAFHWIYVLIAGGVILLFFIGIVMKQKTASEERLSIEVVQILNSILVGASVSENTKNIVSTSGLADYTIEFKCEGFGIKNKRFQELPLRPYFAPKELQTTQMILWSVPYKMPFKVMDLLFITSSNTKYFVVGNGNEDFYFELQNSTAKLNFEYVTSTSKISKGGNMQMRVVDVNGKNIQEGGAIPSGLLKVADKYVTGVSFLDQKVTYYQKKDTKWKKTGETSIVSVAEEKDAAKYAAMFAGDADNYKCGMQKVFKRLQYINEVHIGKLAELKKYYSDLSKKEAAVCNLILTSGTSNLANVLGQIKGTASSCAEDYSYCTGLVKQAQALEKLNMGMQNSACIRLY